MNKDCQFFQQANAQILKALWNGYQAWQNSILFQVDGVFYKQPHKRKLQAYLFIEKVIFGLNLSQIKVRNAYICIKNISVSSTNSDFNKPPSETDLFMYEMLYAAWNADVIYI